MRLTAPVVALALSLWGITTPSLWRDEAATIAAVRRPFGELIIMLGHVDAVHAAYYMMIWPLVRLFGSSELVVRLPSALATAAAAGAVAATGRRMISPSAGLLAGLVFAVLPGVTRYAQEARSYALVMAVAAGTSLLLVRVLGSEPGQRRRRLTEYGASMAALGILNIFGLLLIAAHFVTVLIAGRRAVAGEGSRLIIGWFAAVAASVALASPLLVFGWRERGQISWLTVNKSSSGPGTVLTLAGSLAVTLTVLAVLVIAITVSVVRSQDQSPGRGQGEGRGRGQGKGGTDWRAAWRWPLLGLTVPWLILPPAILLLGSLITPVYTSRYILICLPALALLGGSALAALGKRAAAVGLIVILAAGWPVQLEQRGPAGHYDDIRGIDQVVAARARPGDVVLYTNPNSDDFAAAYSFGLDALRNVELLRPAIQSGTLGGTTVSLRVLKQRLRHVRRVWVVEINKFVQPPQLENLSGLPIGRALRGPGLSFRQVQVWHFHGDWLLLYVRRRHMHRLSIPVTYRNHLKAISPTLT
jgi:mannosyltransferase